MKRITNMIVCGEGVRISVLLILLLVTGSRLLFSSPMPQKATRQTAVAAFERNDNESALRQFAELSATYPKDPLYKYYRGVCLVKLERDLPGAVVLLSDALKGSAAIRSVPPDAHFWLGRALQMTGNFQDALASYESFSFQAGKKISKEMDVPGYIKQCQDKKGMVTDALKPGININEPVENRTQRATDTVSVIKIPPEDPTQEYDSLASVALVLQMKADSVSLVADKLRPEMTVAEGQKRSELKAKIQDLDRKALDYRRRADIEMTGAQGLSGRKVTPDTTFKAEIPIVFQAEQKDSVVQVNPIPQEPVLTAPPEKEIYSEFSISEKPVVNPGEKVIVNPDVPPGLVYRIQVAVFRNPVAPDYFRGMAPVHGFRNEANGITTYYAGMFRLSADASKALTKVKGLGFKDSFVAALMERKAVTPDRAAILEKEWGVKPLYKVKAAVPDTVPQTLVYRVEIKRSAKPLPASQVDNMRIMTGNRGFDIIITGKKESVYLAGKFLTFKSASEFADLLIRNGFRESKVTAYLGNREIPLETARQLFDER